MRNRSRDCPGNDEHTIIIGSGWLLVLDHLAIFVENLISHCRSRIGLLQERVIDRLRISSHDGMNRLGNLTDVALKDIAAQAFAAHALSLAQVCAKLAATLHQCKFHFLANLIVISNGFFALARERNPDRSHMDHDHQRSHWNSAARLRQVVVLPARLAHGLETGTCTLLE